MYTESFIFDKRRNTFSNKLAQVVPLFDNKLLLIILLFFNKLLHIFKEQYIINFVGSTNFNNNNAGVV